MLPLASVGFHFSGLEIGGVPLYASVWVKGNPDEKDLEGRPWCHGERYSLADIAVGCCLGWLGFRKPGEVDWENDYPAAAKHYRKRMERASFSETVPQAPK